MWKKIQKTANGLYCSRLWQAIQRGGGKDKAGKKLIRAGLWRDAEKHYARNLESYPDKVLFLERMALVKRKLGKYADSEAILAGLAAKYPGVTRFSVQLATILDDRGKRHEAIDTLEQALLYSPNSIRMWMDLARIDGCPENWEKRKNNLLRCIKANKRNDSFLITFCDNCYINNNIAVVVDILQAMKCGKYIKEYFLEDHVSNEKTKKELFGRIPHYSAEYFAGICAFSGFQLMKRALRHCDMQSEYVNIFDGARKTIGVPETHEKTIYLIGASPVYGSPGEDAYTIASFLQSQCTSSFGGEFRVVNMGVSGITNLNAFLIVLDADLRGGDMVFHFPHFAGNRFLNSDFTEEIRHYRVIRDFCALRKASFHIALLPSILRIENPSRRERVLQAIDSLDGNTSEVINQSRKSYAGFAEKLRESDIQFVSLEAILNRPHDLGEVFVDPRHFNYRANRAIAGEVHAHAARPARIPDIQVFNAEMEDMKREAVQMLKTVTIERYASQNDMTPWLRQARNPGFDGCDRVGAIVMNCNPFTFGHRHLIETAAGMVDALYIFVVQEDRSLFPFEERLSLVRQGIEGIAGAIHVAPSGEFIISNFSFAGYFAKTQAVRPSDSTIDVMIFGSIIAPELGITHRFVGEEPNCVTTNAYNDTMNFLLPALGVEVCVIPRKTDSGEPISATTVRSCLENNDFETIARLVPATTCEYLRAFSEKRNMRG